MKFVSIPTRDQDRALAFYTDKRGFKVVTDRVVSYLARQRTREIGIRIAVGAQPRDVLSIFVGEALRWTAAGIVVGFAIASALGRLAAGFLFGVSPFDPLTFVTTAIGLIASVLIARPGCRRGVPPASTPPARCATNNGRAIIRAHPEARRGRTAAHSKSW